jgi:hypothetical protein
VVTVIANLQSGKPAPPYSRRLSYVENYVFEEGLGTENSSCVCRKQTGAAEQVYQNVLHDIMFCNFTAIFLLV